MLEAGLVDESETLYFFNDTATAEIYTLSLHDALPIYDVPADRGASTGPLGRGDLPQAADRDPCGRWERTGCGSSATTGPKITTTWRCRTAPAVGWRGRGCPKGWPGSPGCTN